jgi:uncharacterized membrane protein
MATKWLRDMLNPTILTRNALFAFCVKLLASVMPALLTHWNNAKMARIQHAKKCVVKAITIVIVGLPIPFVLL